MALAGIEVRYLTRRMAELTRGYYVANIYGIARDALLIKLHHPERDDVLLMVSTRGVWPTSSRVGPIEPNAMVSRLRRSIARLRLAKVSQPGEERIVTLDFEGLDTSMRVICEFFGGGNVVLCDMAGKIHALLRTVDVKHRMLRVGEQYAMPPASELGAIGATVNDLLRMQQTTLSAAKWLGRSVGLPSRYIERIFADADVDPKSPGRDVNDDAVGRIHASLDSIVNRVVGGDHDLEVADSGSGARTVNPIRLVEGAIPAPGRTFEDLVDETFTAEILDAGRAARSAGTDRRTKELESQLGEQARAIRLVRQRAGEISKAARAIQKLASEGATSTGDARVATALAECGAQVVTKRGRPVIRVADCDVAAPAGQSLYAAASALYDESKVQAAAEATIAARQKKIEAELCSLRERAATESRTIGAARVRKKAWYERYRWFYTTDGLLAVGGRDSSSNSSLVRRRLEDGDIVFHADISGSPFFLLKRGGNAPPASLNEVAHATVCFSRAWREGMHGTSAYWVNPDQLKKAAPSGQFLSKGSFSVEGKRNYLRAPTLRLAVGATEIGGAYVVSCGPPTAIRGSTACYSVIEPGGSAQSDAAKRIKSELARLNAALGGVDLDEIVRALPAGPTHIVESVVGDAAA